MMSLIVLEERRGPSTPPSQALRAWPGFAQDDAGWSLSEWWDGSSSPPWQPPSRGKCGSMKFHTEYLTLHTKTKRAYIHLTPQVESALKKSGIKDGMILVSAMHITAGVYVNDYESGLIKDIDQWLETLAPF